MQIMPGGSKQGANPVQALLALWSSDPPLCSPALQLVMAVVVCYKPVAGILQDNSLLQLYLTVNMRVQTCVVHVVSQLGYMSAPSSITLPASSCHVLSKAASLEQIQRSSRHKTRQDKTRQDKTRGTLHSQSSKVSSWAATLTHQLVWVLCLILLAVTAISS